MIENSKAKSKILIVDDASENLHTMMAVLHNDYTIIVATNGEKALKLAVHQPQPDLILLDIKMPGMDGYEVLRRLKADPLTAQIPVIFVTALSEATDEAKGLSMGAAEYIVKPTSPDLLKTRVLTQLELQHYRKKSIPTNQPEKAPLKSRFNILIVDDVPENIHTLIDALSEEYRIMVANNGQRAIELVNSSNPPDLILLDIVMPGMDGYEVCRQIKKSKAGSGIPILFLSILDEAVEKVRGFSVGAADYISKPFDIDEVRARIRTHLQLTQLQLYLEQQVEQQTASLRSITRQLLATLDAIPDLLFEVNLAGHYWNVHIPHHIPLTEQVKNYLLGEYLQDVLPPAANEVCMQGLHEANKTGWSHGRKLEISLPQGRYWFELSIAKKLDISNNRASSEDDSFVVLARDITERKKNVA